MAKKKKQERYRVWMRRPGSWAEELTTSTSMQRAMMHLARFAPRQPEGTQMWIEPA